MGKGRRNSCRLNPDACGELLAIKAAKEPSAAVRASPVGITARGLPLLF